MTKKQHPVFYVIRIIFNTVAIFFLNNLLFLSANVEMPIWFNCFSTCQCVTVCAEVYPRVTTNEGFRTLHKSVKHLLYTLDSPSEGIIFLSFCIQFCIAILYSVPLGIKNKMQLKQPFMHDIILKVGTYVTIKSESLANQSVETRRNGWKKRL